jgi:hypothetical protein
MKLRAAVELELDRLNGKHEEASRRLESSIDGTELYLTHIAWMNLLYAKGDFAGARNQSRWLAAHRGRAYAEVAAGDMFLPLYVAYSNIALLVDAECSASLGETAQARKAMEAFKGHWDEKTLPPPFQERLHRLAGKLSEASGDSATR